MRCRTRSVRPVWLSLAALVAVAGCGSGRDVEPKAAGSARVQVVPVRRGEVIRRLSLPGTVRAIQEATLYAKVAGYLQSIAVDEGDRVAAGADLATIEAPEMLADLEKFRVEANVASRDSERLRSAQSKAPDLVTLQSVDTAKARTEVARAALRRTETLLGYAKITAPFAGIVTRRWVDPGAFIPAATSSSAAKNAAVLTLMDFDRVRIDVAIPESEVSHVAQGQPATITAKELPGRSFAAEITRFAYALDETTRTMPAQIELANGDLALRPGMLVDVTIEVERKPDALLLPAQAIVSEKQGHFVYAVTDQKARKVPVELGVDDGTSVEIKGELAPGEAVVVAGREGLAEGQPVEAVPVP